MNKKEVYQYLSRLYFVNPYDESSMLKFDIYTDNFFEFCEQLMQQVREKKLRY